MEVRRWDYHPNHIRQIQDFSPMQPKKIPGLYWQHIAEDPNKLLVPARRIYRLGSLPKISIDGIKRVQPHYYP